MSEERKIEELTYAEAAHELEEIVRALDAGSLELEASLAYYKRGRALVENLNERLEGAQKEVEKLSGADAESKV